MIELALDNKKGKINIKSSDVKDILESRPDFEYIQDISETIKQEGIMVYDCQLSKEIFNADNKKERKLTVNEIHEILKEKNFTDKVLGRYISSEAVIEIYCFK